jgi:arylsulfatase A-like enzyme
MSRATLWRVAIATAVVSGLTQALLVGVARTTTGRIVFASRDIVWMAPLADAGVFAVAALGLAFAVTRLDEKAAARLTFAVCAFLFLIGPAMMVPRLHPAAALLLCAGAATQAGRLAVPYRDRLRAIAVWMLVAGVAATTLLGAGIRYLPGVAERSRANAPTGGQRTPSVLLLVLDTVRAQNLGLYGYARPTSRRLDEFASRSTVFERVFSPSPWTLPAHASLFTGRFPHELSADWLTPLDARHPTLAETLTARGYATAAFVGNLLYCPSETGLSRGFARYEDYPVSAATMISTSWLTRPVIGPLRQLTGDPDRFVRKRASDVNAEFLDWLDRRSPEPFFAFLNYFDAHAPYAPPAPFNAMFGEPGPPLDITVRRTWSPREIQRSMDSYDGALAYLDHEVGDLLDRLRQRGRLDNTLVVVTSDHGEQFGEHGLFDHANSLYRQVLQVPLVVSMPGRIPAGRRVPHPVSLIDIAATILDVTGAAAGARLPGESLARYWGQRADAPAPAPVFLAEVSKGINTPAWVPVSAGAMKSVIGDGFHYIRHTSGREELFDLEQDAAEIHNLSERTDRNQALERSRRTLDTLLAGEARTAGSRREGYAAAGVRPY